jgi:hypothetical protein
MKLERLWPLLFLALGCSSSGSKAIPDAGSDLGQPTQPDQSSQEVLYALTGGDLVIINTSTHEVTKVGTPGGGWALAYDRQDGRLWTLLGWNTVPSLAPIDPCTGTLGTAVPISVVGSVVSMVEGFALDSLTGQAYVAASLDGSDALSETLLSVNRTTGKALPAAQIGSRTNDADALFNIGSRWFVLDCPDGTSPCPIYGLDLQTGKATLATTSGHHLQNATMSSTSTAAYASDMKELFAFNLMTGTMTQVLTSPSAIEGLAFAPRACPVIIP